MWCHKTEIAQSCAWGFFPCHHLLFKGVTHDSSQSQNQPLFCVVSSTFLHFLHENKYKLIEKILLVLVFQVQFHKSTTIFNISRTQIETWEFCSNDSWKCTLFWNFWDISISTVRCFFFFFFLSCVHIFPQTDNSMHNQIKWVKIYSYTCLVDVFSKHVRPVIGSKSVSFSL